MDGREEKPRTKIDLHSETGLTRRDLLRRGAIVGGSLVWIAPAIQSFGARAYASQGPSPGTCAACYCFTLDSGNLLVKDFCDDNGVNGFKLNADSCENWCKHQSGFDSSTGAPGGPYADSQYCSGASCVCDQHDPGQPVGSATCS